MSSTKTGNLQNSLKLVLAPLVHGGAGAYCNQEWYVQYYPSDTQSLRPPGR